MEQTRTKSIFPFSAHDNVAVVLAANNYFIPFVSTFIHSIAGHANAQKFYDIIILHQDVSDENRIVLEHEFSHLSNFRLSFYDMSERTEEFEGLFVFAHYSVETYFRLFIQDILSDYDKVLYLDSDMIAREDISLLYDEDIEGYLLGAAHDPDFAAMYKGAMPSKKVYAEKDLKLKNPLDYFQAGTILFNLNEMRKSFTVGELVTFANLRKWDILDQDVLNYFAQGRVKFIDMAWNMMVYDQKGERKKYVKKYVPGWMNTAYEMAHSNPKIIHFAGKEKPWNTPESDWTLAFWEVARLSVFYETILGRLIDNRGKLQAERTVEFSLLQTIFKRRLFNVWIHFLNLLAPEGSKRRKWLHDKSGQM